MTTCKISIVNIRDLNIRGIIQEHSVSDTLNKDHSVTLDIGNLRRVIHTLNRQGHLDRHTRSTVAIPEGVLHDPVTLNRIAVIRVFISDAPYQF